MDPFGIGGCVDDIRRDLRLPYSSRPHLSRSRRFGAPSEDPTLMHPPGPVGNTCYGS
jgi:hypothetical protein